MINLNLCAEIPASSRISFALAECSRSESIEVKVASFGAPLKIQRPLTPEPVPISTIDFAEINPATKFIKPPTPTVGSGAPISAPFFLACCIKKSSCGKFSAKADISPRFEIGLSIVIAKSTTRLAI